MEHVTSNHSNKQMYIFGIKRNSFRIHIFIMGYYCNEVIVVLNMWTCLTRILDIFILTDNEWHKLQYFSHNMQGIL